MDHEAEQVNVTSLEVLGPDFVRLHTNSLDLKEDFIANNASISAEIKQQVGSDEKTFTVSGTGVGLLDAYFEALLASYSKEYISLNAVSIVDFNISTKTTGHKGSHTDAMAIASVRVKNSDRHEYSFTHKSGSVSQSSIGAVQDVLQFFINSERAYTKLHMALEDAGKRSRPDLIQRYQIQMSTLVKATSYREIAERLKSAA